MGPDVGEVIRVLHSAREAEPTLNSERIIGPVAETSGLSERLIRIAIGYWADYPDEIEKEITAAAPAADEAFERWTRKSRWLL